MKEIIIKNGSKTIIKIVPDDWEETKDIPHRDLTTSGQRSIGFSDISDERWKEIFSNKS